MIKININKDSFVFKNLYHSFFSDLNEISYELTEDKFSIFESSKKNSDPASIDLQIKNNKFIVNYWDGYSLAEEKVFTDYLTAKKQFKKYAKKLARNLRKY